MHPLIFFRYDGITYKTEEGNSSWERPLLKIIYYVFCPFKSKLLSNSVD